jgi:hypothetical protein
MFPTPGAAGPAASGDLDEVGNQVEANVELGIYGIASLFERYPPKLAPSGDAGATQPPGPK